MSSRRSRLFAVVAALLFFPGAAISVRAQTPDPHYASPRIAPLVRQSTFVHGYLHGYEEGFSMADLDMQMAREPGDPSRRKQARKATGYRAEFGSRASFDAGYKQGLRVGYADGMAGRAFRAVDQLERVMQLRADAGAAAPPMAPPRPMVPRVSAVLDGLALSYIVPPAGTPRREASPASHASVFDQGFSKGYSSGQHRGLGDARGALPFAAPLSTCPPNVHPKHPSGEFCTGYVRGYALGYSDGYVNVARPAELETAARSK